MPFKIVRNDITKMQVDAIVNTANSAPVYSDGVDTAVYEAAGAEALLAERRKIGFLEEGEVAITPGFALPAKYIIHAVSPLYIDGACGEEERLRSCYRNSLELAKENNCNSIAFPLISTGSFGYPKAEALGIALEEIGNFLLWNSMTVFLVVFDEESTALGKRLAPALEAYIDANYVEEKQQEEYREPLFSRQRTRPMLSYNRRPEKHPEERKLSAPGPSLMSAPSAQRMECQMAPMPVPTQKSASAPKAEPLPDFSDFLEENQSALKERMRHMSDTFQEYLLYLIESGGLTNAEVYKGALLTKQLFSKIKLNPQYHPDKATAMRLCVGARLNLDETKDLLARAGYALSPCDKRDIIFSFFIEHEVFDMIEIDIALEEHGLPCFIE